MRQQKQPVLPSLSALLEPGERKAILKFENGEQIDLGRVASGTLLSRQGGDDLSRFLTGVPICLLFRESLNPCTTPLKYPEGENIDWYCRMVRWYG